MAAGSARPALDSTRAARAGSGITSRLILAYIERERGRAAVGEVLERSALPYTEVALRDESLWFSFDEKIALWSAAEAVLGDRAVAEHVGAAVLDFNIASSLRRGLRALGTPQLVYRNIVRANSKFNWAHRLELLESGGQRARLRYVDVSGVGYHHYDCDYTRGLLSTIPRLFGLPPARVNHTTCALHGADCCVFDVTWQPSAQGVKRGAFAVATGTAALTGSSLVLGPPGLIAAAAVLITGSGAVALSGVQHLRRRIESLEGANEEIEASRDRLASSLRDLSSDLHLDDVLRKITERAQTAVGGKEFALLIADGSTMHAERHSGISPGGLAALERWATESRAALEQAAIVIDDVSDVPTLSALASDRTLPLGSLCAAPLVFRDELLGVLVALAHGSEVFFEHDQAALRAYAAQAAIALSNARLVTRLERQASEDPLTGLANQRAFKRAYEEELARSAREDTPVAVIMVDIDHFKAINDTRGHLFGDEILRRAAAELAAAVRTYDVTARLGGDEFAVLLPGTSPETAMDLAERVRAAVSRVALDGMSVSTSVGVASWSPGDGDPDLLRLADGALYAAKDKGRANTVHVGARGRLNVAR